MGGFYFITDGNCLNHCSGIHHRVQQCHKTAFVKIRGMAEKFVDTSAIRKSNALLKKRFAQFQAAISYEYISEILCNLKL